jgi:exopolysaccharide biosynthesis polyprenyl glycosylphosphotransferase
MINRTNRLFIALGLIGCDLAGLLLAFIAAYSLRLHLSMFTQVQPLAQYLLPLATLALLSILVFYQQGLYRDIRDLSMLEEYAKIIKSFTYAILLALSLTFFFKFYERSRILVLLYWSVALIFLVCFRYGFYQYVKYLRAQGWNHLRVAVLGPEKKVRGMRELLLSYPMLGYHIAAEIILSPSASSQGGALRKKIDLEILPRFQRGDIDSVIISDTVKNYQRIHEGLEILKEYRIPCRQVAEAFDLAGFKAPAGEGLEGLLGTLDEGQSRGGYKVLKRFLDETMSLTLLVLTLPFWIVAIVAIKLDSAGPVFFRQERVGYQGRKFLIYKFRSMYVGAPRYAKTPHSTRDPRITRVGAWLRKTSVDELPQLINVIKGDMSMVGPRPEMPFIVEKYKPIYRYRLSVLPGMTGLWQVSGRTDKPLEENIKYDLYYIKNQSLLLDLVILLRTFPTVLLGKGAY